MSAPLQPQPVSPLLVPTRARPPERHALGLPAGSVRAFLAIMVLVILGLVVLMHAEAEVKTLYAYLWFMLFLIIASFFAAHGKSIGVAEVHSGSPLGLPRGSVRILILLGFAGIVAWLYKEHRLFEEPPAIPAELILVMPAGFFVGWLVSLVVRGLSSTGQEPFWFQDVEAWAAVVAMLLLLVDFLIHAVINRNLLEENKIDPRILEAVMAGLVSFYFGARS